MCLLAVGVILHSVYTLIPVAVSILFLIWGIKDAQTQKVSGSKNEKRWNLVTGRKAEAVLDAAAHRGGTEGKAGQFK